MEKETVIPAEDKLASGRTGPLAQTPGPRPPRRSSRLLLVIVISVLLCATLVAVSATVGINFLQMGSMFPSVATPKTGAPGGNGSTATAVPANSQVVGHLSLMSSGQITEMTSDGILDELQLDLTNIPAPAAGNTYYAWMLGGNKIEGNILPLGALTITNGAVHLMYPGNQHHTNLLGLYDHFLVTEESAAAPPTVPTTDTTRWRFSAAYSNIPNPQDTAHHFSLLDHLRHLLSSDPKLTPLGLPGGIEIWLFKNTQKVVEYASSARDDWAEKSTDLMHRQFIRILDYLDGSNYVLQDVPAGTPILIDQRIAQVGLLEMDPAQQDPPGHLYHIGIHLQGVTQAPGATVEQYALANRIGTAVDMVQVALKQVRQDAKQLVVMTDQQILQPSSLTILNDMLTEAQYAFAGQFDQATGSLQNGVEQIHYIMQQLATINVVVAKP